MQLARPQRGAWTWIGVISLITADQTLKALVYIAGPPASAPHNLIILGPKPNPDGPFSIPLPLPLLITVAAAVVGYIIYLLTREDPLASSKATRGLVLISAGGLSNVTDRILHGTVIDILSISSLSLNAADIFIAAGALLLVIDRAQSYKTNAAAALHLTNRG